MKVRTKSVPKDQLSIEEGDKTIHIFTHRQLICLSADSGFGAHEDAFHELTFSQLHALIRNLKVEEIK